MVVLSAAVTTKNGKALVARQFVNMSRIRIEGLLAAFPKLMGGGRPGTQHTFIETDSVRYVYQPIEGLFLLLVTNKASNIVEDLETLRLLSKLVPEIAGGIDEEAINAKMFDLVFAFDEVITTGGHRESISMAQISTNLLMESHEEKLHKMIQQSKETQAKEEADRKAKVFREEKRAAKMAGLSSTVSGMAGIEGGGGGGGGGSDGSGCGGSSSSGCGGGTGMMAGDVGVGAGSGFDSDDRAPPSVSSYGAPSPTPEAPVVPKKGMQLGLGKGKKQSMMDKLVSEDNLAPLAPIAPAGGGGGASEAAGEAAPVPQAADEPVSIVLEEKVSASLNREGALESLEVKGTMQLTANQDAALCCKVQLGGSKSAGFAFQTHPKVDKKLYEQNGQLSLKDAAKGFPKGKAVGILRWSMSTTSEDQVPISINCWPEPDGADMNVNVEYTCEKPGIELHNVLITIPLGTSAAPQVVDCGSGTHRHNHKTEELVWEIEMIDGSNKTASLEFNVQQRDSDAFFPISVAFRSQQLAAGVDVGAVVHSESGAPIQYGVSTSVSTDVYKVE
mmetsp:Transcript_21726/g.44598  ORF Transcript_21726/g.44598 Transcript_21726/m.44598 type:complete len:559 (-) Transcript_21726:213-1889(-)